jgi:Na+-transporting NADH:ubiquinone oxidoreductase, subunit NqrD
VNLSDAKKYRKKYKYLTVPLLLGLDLPFVVATGVSLMHAVAMGMEMMMIHFITVLVAFITVRILPRWARPIANVTVSTSVMLVARYIITLYFPAVRSSSGLYIYLMAVNGMTILRSNALSVEDRPVRVLITTFVEALAFSAIIVPVAFVRELFGNGTLWAHPVALPFRLSGMLVPFFGFIVVGFMYAGIRLASKKLVVAQMHFAHRKDLFYQPEQPD